VSSNNPYLFVVGCPRSGTTLLQRMLDNHPALAVINDSHFIPAAIDGSIQAGDVALNPEMISRARSFRSRSGKTGFFRLGLSDTVVDEAALRARTYRGFVTGLYDEVARSHGKQFAGEKTPDYVRHIPLLHHLFPRARFLHIIRDGRSVALSLREWAAGGKGPARFELWAEEPVAMCALWWRWQVGAGRRDGPALGRSTYREVRYEELVSRPELELEEITRFLGLSQSPQILQYHEGRMRDKPGLSAKQAWLPPTPGLRDWQQEMSEADLEVFEAAAGDLLSELGYQRTRTTVSPELARRSEKWREWWSSVAAEASPRPPTMAAGGR
jgi:hypothetical protein